MCLPLPRTGRQTAALSHLPVRGWPVSFTAKYSGACAYGDRIEPGDQCTYTDDDEIAHAECDQLDGPANIHQAPAPFVCPKCRLTHAGECF